MLLWEVETAEMSHQLQIILDAARQLPLAEQQRLAESLLENIHQSSAQTSITSGQAAALAIVEELYGAIKGLDRETLTWIAEDEELCGY
jgi:hypothetical protein